MTSTDPKQRAVDRLTMDYPVKVTKQPTTNQKVKGLSVAQRRKKES